MIDQRGSTLIEVTTIGILLMVPLIWVLAVLADVHRAALAATSAAREAAFDAARTTDSAAAGDAVDEAVRRASRDHGFRPAAARVRWWASPGMRRGGAVRVAVTYSIPVFRAPLIGVVARPALSIGATHSAPIDLYRSRP